MNNQKIINFQKIRLTYIKEIITIENKKNKEGPVKAPLIFL